VLNSVDVMIIRSSQIRQVIRTVVHDEECKMRIVLKIRNRWQGGEHRWRAEEDWNWPDTIRLGTGDRNPDRDANPSRAIGKKQFRSIQ
jgi:hypothetical protein